MPGAPYTWVKPIWGGPATCRAPARPCSCRTTSCTCRSPDAPTGSPLARQPPSVLIGNRPVGRGLAEVEQLLLGAVFAQARSRPCGRSRPRNPCPAAARPARPSGRCRMRRTRPAPRRRSGYGRRPAVTTGANTSNEPNRRVRLATAARLTGRSHMSAARSLRASTTAAAPSAGEHSMYCVSGGLMTRADRISSSVSAVRRQAVGLSSPQRKRFGRHLCEQRGP